MKTLRLAVVGAGHLGRLHALKLRAQPGVELAGIVDPLPASRDRVAAEVAAPAYADCRPLLDSIDAAIIATPTGHHRQVALALLERGVHLLVEKPLALNVRDAEEMVRAARQKSVVLQVGHSERFNPALAAALPYVQEPKFIQAARHSSFAGRSTDIGVVLDLMIHDIDLVLSMARALPRQVEALGFALLGRHEDVAHARLAFDNGCVAVLSASRVSYQSERRMQIWSRWGFAALDFAGPTAAFVRPCEAVRERRFDVEDLAPAERLTIKDRLFTELLPLEQLPIEPCDALTAEQADFLDSIRSLRAPRVSGEAGRDALAVAEQVLARIETHSWDGAAGGAFGPLAVPAPRVIPTPHFDLSPAAAIASAERRAG